MPAEFNNLVTQQVLDQILQPLVGAHLYLHGDLSTKVADFAKGLFGTEKFEEMLKTKKEQLKDQANGSVGEGITRTLMCRAYVQLTNLGEITNAEELKGLVCEKFDRVDVDAEIERVRGGL